MATPEGLLSDASTVTAHQSVALRELGDLLGQMDFDTGDALRREDRVSEGLASTSDSLGSLRAQLLGLGARIPDTGASKPSRPVAPERRYHLPDVPSSLDFNQLTALAEERLRDLDIDLSRDPLTQILPTSQVAETAQQFAADFGETRWDSVDWGIVLTAGVIASLLDTLLVGTPKLSELLGKEYPGSPLTTWLKDKERCRLINEQFFKKFEAVAKVPFDASTTIATDGLVAGLTPAAHRLMSPGHDPLIGYLVGVSNIMHGTGTYFDKFGNLIRIASDADPVDLTTALITQTQHLLSDWMTPAGVPAPGFSVLQAFSARTPFALGDSSVRDMSRYMYLKGYDLRHSFTMGITPGVVSALIRGGWLAKSYLTEGTAAERKRDHIKLTSMLLMGHTIATGGTLIKAALFGMNPAALNYNQILAMGPAVLMWLKEAQARDSRIDAALEQGWLSLLSEVTQAPAIRSAAAIGESTA